MGISAPGYGVPMFLGYTATWGDRLRYYGDLPSMVTDGFTTDSPEYLAASAALSQSPRPVQVAIGRGTLKPTQAYVLGIQSTAAVTVYSVAVAGKGVTSTTVSFTTLVDISGTLLPRTGNTLTSTAHGMVTGDGPYYVSNSGGGLPAGLTTNTAYWIINIAANTFQFASTKANALALTPVTLTTDGTGTQTILRGSTNQDVIMAQLLQGLNAVVGANYTAVQSGSAGSQILTVTGNAAGNWFSLSISDAALLTNKQTHADPGVATDLAAIVSAQSNWYGLGTLYNSQAYVTAAAAWTQGNSRIYVFDVPETLALTTVGGAGGSADTLDAQKTLANSRVMGAYCQTPAAFMGAAWMGRLLPLNPGSATWKFKTLSGVPALIFTATQRANLRTRGANGNENVSGVNVTFEGTAFSGDFLDAIVGDDWVASTMQVNIFNVMAGSNKLEFEDTGVAIIESAVRATLKLAVERKVYAASPPPVVTVPLVASLSASNKSTRTLVNVNWTATRSGAIHITAVQGYVSL